MKHENAGWQFDSRTRLATAFRHTVCNSLLSRGMKRPFCYAILTTEPDDVVLLDQNSLGSFEQGLTHQSR